MLVKLASGDVHYAVALIFIHIVILIMNDIPLRKYEQCLSIEFELIVKYDLWSHCFVLLQSEPVCLIFNIY